MPGEEEPTQLTEHSDVESEAGHGSCEYSIRANYLISEDGKIIVAATFGHDEYKDGLKWVPSDDRGQFTNPNDFDLNPCLTGNAMTSRDDCWSALDDATYTAIANLGEQKTRYHNASEADKETEWLILTNHLGWLDALDRLRRDTLESEEVLHEAFEANTNVFALSKRDVPKASTGYNLSQHAKIFTERVHAGLNVARTWSRLLSRDIEAAMGLGESCVKILSTDLNRLWAGSCKIAHISAQGLDRLASFDETESAIKQSDLLQHVNEEEAPDAPDGAEPKVDIVRPEGKDPLISVHLTLEDGSAPRFGHMSWVNADTSVYPIESEPDQTTLSKAGLRSLDQMTKAMTQIRKELKGRLRKSGKDIFQKGQDIDTRWSNVDKLTRFVNESVEAESLFYHVDDYVRDHLTTLQGIASKRKKENEQKLQANLDRLTDSRQDLVRQWTKWDGTKHDTSSLSDAREARSKVLDHLFVYGLDDPVYDASPWKNDAASRMETVRKVLAASLTNDLLEQEKIWKEKASRLQSDRQDTIQKLANYQSDFAKETERLAKELKSAGISSIPETIDDLLKSLPAREIEVAKSSKEPGDQQSVQSDKGFTVVANRHGGSSKSKGKQRGGRSAGRGRKR